MAQVEHNQAPVPTPAPKIKEGEGPEKSYHCKFPGANFTDRSGTAHPFNHSGVLTTTDLAVQDELDKIADKPGSIVYTKESPTPDPKENAPTNDIQSRAAAAMAGLQASQHKG